MENSKIYVVANPALRLKMLRTELAENSIIFSVSKDGINQTGIENFLYSEIASVNISLIDINRNQICIELKSGKKLKLISLSLGKLKDGKIYRETVNQAVEFNEWVSHFHKILIDKKLAHNIEFSEGSNGKLMILAVLLIVCVIGIIFAIIIEKNGMACTLMIGAVTVGALLLKMGVNKKYAPENKILV